MPGLTLSSPLHIIMLFVHTGADGYVIYSEQNSTDSANKPRQVNMVDLPSLTETVVITATDVASVSHSPPLYTLHQCISPLCILSIYQLVFLLLPATSFSFCFIMFYCVFQNFRDLEEVTVSPDQQYALVRQNSDSSSAVMLSDYTIYRVSDQWSVALSLSLSYHLTVVQQSDKCDVLVG